MGTKKRHDDPAARYQLPSHGARGSVHQALRSVSEDRSAKEALSPVERLEIKVHAWSGFVIMPIFALANAGVAISWSDIGNPISVALFAGLVVGKPVGVLASAWLAVRSGIAARPEAMKGSVIAGGSMLTGIGFTMSLFIAGLALAPALLGAAKIGILGASVVAGTAGYLVLRWLTSAKQPAVTGRQHPDGRGLDSVTGASRRGARTAGASASITGAVHA